VARPGLNTPVLVVGAAFGAWGHRCHTRRDNSLWGTCNRRSVGWGDIGSQLGPIGPNRPAGLSCVRKGLY
jgi:hypothetical protein